MYYKIMKVGWQ